MEMWDILAIIVLLLCGLVGLAMTAVRLPGTWLIVLAAVCYGWLTGWERVSLGLAAVLAGAAVVGEIVEFLASIVTAKQAGASRAAGWGGLVGGIVGMIFLSIPVPILGTVIGAVLGCFAGAAITEFVVRREVTQGTKVGVFSAIGFVLGTATKTAIALVMAGLLLTSVVCSRPAAVLPTPEAEEHVEAVHRCEVSWSGGLFRAPSASAGWSGVPVARAPGSESTAKPPNTHITSCGAIAGFGFSTGC